MKGKKWILAHHFVGVPKDTDLQLMEEDVPEVKEGEVLTEAVALTVDPYMRAYSARMKEGQTMIGNQVARVLESKCDEFPVGTLVTFSDTFAAGWRTHIVAPGNKVQKIPDVGDLPPSLAVGILGMPGATAYFGFLELCQPKAGEVLVVNAAAGAVGSVVGQIAKIKGCIVIGYAGSEDKCEWLKELGFDFAFNYKTCNLDATLREAAPDGVDMYFDNVGGDFTVTVLQHMKQFGRISVCGSIANYNDTEVQKVPTPWFSILSKQLRVEGFIVLRWFDRWPEAFKEMGKWIKEGKLKYREHVTKGFENMRQALYEMLQGKNTGKAVVLA